MRHVSNFSRKKRNAHVFTWIGLIALSWILIFAVVGTGSSVEPQDDGAVDKNPVKEHRNQVVVTYFHTNYRCPTCTKLEKYSREAVEKNYGKELQDKTMVFLTLNVDEPENKHYVKDYSLYTKSLIVAHTRDGKVVSWKNLPDIWKLVRDRDRFEEYVLNEVREFMKDL